MNLRGNLDVAFKAASGSTKLEYFSVKDFMHACDLIKNILKNNGPDAERLREVLRACPLRDGTYGSVLGDAGDDTLDLSRLHPESVSQLALYVQLRYLESVQWDRANQNSLIQQKDNQLRISQDKLQANSQRIQELEREVERLKRDRERLTTAVQNEDDVERRVKSRINAARVEFNEEYRRIKQAFPNAERAIEECHDIERKVFKKLLN